MILRFPRRTVASGAAAVLVALALGLGLGQAFRDDAPPALWIEGPDRVAAGSTVELRVSADEPATYRFHYGDRTVERVEQDLVIAFEALPGVVPIRIEAVDAAGNAAEARHLVEGVVVPEGRWARPDGLRPGDPFSAELAFTPAGAEVDALRALVAGRPAPVLAEGDRRWALGVVPLATEAGSVPLLAEWRDGLGRTAAAAASLPYGALDATVEELRIAPSTLAVVTPQAREQEAEALAAVAATVADPPRWTEPFLLPIEGRGTSGFGRPRRYAPGGPVSFHLGEDIAAPEGTPIRATNDGVVVLAGTYPIKGGLTVVDHGAGVTSLYFHQSRLHVQAGDVVTRGQTIGEVGSTGLSTGPHLHWEMRVDDVPSDPVAWVDRVRP